MRSLRYMSQILLVAALSVAAWGQMRNPPPASINSIGGTHLGPTFASIYSQPTRNVGFMGVRGNDVGRIFVGPRGERPHGDGRHRDGRNGPARYPYGYPYYGYSYPYYRYGYGYGVTYLDPAESLPGAGTFESQYRNEDEPQPPAPTIFENRPSQQIRAPQAQDSRYGEHYLDARETVPPRPAVAQKEPEPESTVLVFRDGSRSEVTNYAIMGSMVYVFSGERRKIPLAELDVRATVRENDDRGIDFVVPSSQ